MQELLKATSLVLFNFATIVWLLWRQKGFHNFVEYLVIVIELKCISKVDVHRKQTF